MNRHRARHFVFVVAVGLAAVAGCEGQNAQRLEGQPPLQSQTATEQPAPTSAPQDHADAPAQPVGGVLQLGGVNFTPPAAWRDLGPAPMLRAKYLLSPVEGEELAAEVNVAYYGQEMGGDIEANLARWIGQMRTPDGAEASDIALRSKLTTGNGLDVHFVEIDGIYMKSMGGGPMTGGRTQAQPDHRLVGAIVVGPEGNVFIKLVGPQKTARAMEAQLREMLAAATKV